MKAIRQRCLAIEAPQTQRPSGAQRMRNFGMWLASVTALLFFSACGGGGSDPAPAPKPQVTSARADMSKYLGSWTGCGTRLVNLQLHAFSINFYLTTSTGNTAGGTLTIRDFGANSIDCNSNNNAGTSTSNVTLAPAAAPVAVQGIWEGSADQVTLSTTGAADQIIFIGFEPDFKAWQLSPDSSFDRLSTIRYTKF